LSEKDITEDEWLARSNAALRQGEFLMAYDIAVRGCEAFPDNEWLKYQAVLALARSGATERAEELYGSFSLQEVDAEDILSLGARIAKDKYFASRTNQEEAERAAKLYEEIFEKTGGYYPAINAATMWLFAGDEGNCTRLAREALALSTKAGEAANGENRYWEAATQAEAALLLNNFEQAEAAIHVAASELDGNYSSAASTRGQLLRISREKGLNPDILDKLKPPSVVFYAGHMIAPAGIKGQFSASNESIVSAEVERMLEKHGVGFGFGSLACGSDILFAEALLARGAEVHAVIPFEIEEFKDVSVRRGGECWVERMDACLREATTVTQATTSSYLGDDSLFNYSARVAMGFARIRAQNLGSDLKMLAVWNREAAQYKAGTAVDVAYWKDHGFEVEVIDCGSPAEGDARPTPVTENKSGPKRQIYPVVFADVRGFSKLSENDLAFFFEKVMGRLGKVLDHYGDGVLFRNTWGDAVHAVFADVSTAAHCALELQTALREIDAESIGMAVKPEMRMALDVGPVFEGYDYINKEKTYFGTTLTRAARIEPVTPVGEVFVTEAFAALCAFDCAQDVKCEYVGHMPLASSYGKMRMYLLKSTRPSDHLADKAS